MQRREYKSNTNNLDQAVELVGVQLRAVFVNYGRGFEKYVRSGGFAGGYNSECSGGRITTKVFRG